MNTEKAAEIRRLHVPVNRCDTGEHGYGCPGSFVCKNCRRLWPCRFIASLPLDVEAAS